MEVLEIDDGSNVSAGSAVAFAAEACIVTTISLHVPAVRSCVVERL